MCICVYIICINVSGHTGFNCCRGKDPTNIFVLLVEIHCLSSCMCVLYLHHAVIGLSIIMVCLLAPSVISNVLCVINLHFRQNKSPHLYSI